MTLAYPKKKVAPSHIRQKLKLFFGIISHMSLQFSTIPDMLLSVTRGSYPSMIHIGLLKFQVHMRNCPLVYYTYISITHYQSFNAIILTCNLSTSSIITSSTNLYLSHVTDLHHLTQYKIFKIIYLTHMISILNFVFIIVFYVMR
jgi:hypothetical protein